LPENEERKKWTKKQTLHNQGSLRGESRSGEPEEWSKGESKEEVACERGDVTDLCQWGILSVWKIRKTKERKEGTAHGP